ncbi:MAG: excinuclease ABC subunit UvrA [Christensenellaceae bacterium]|jgi:excinuclease ABC subunit A|nr:excinuclease ABC subunit UvrA [Christensenellaceae bacterium]
MKNKFDLSINSSGEITKDSIIVRGARENNLKNLTVVLPRNKLIVFTGLSGSGKSSLAFDTIFAEGQRRYIESLSSYARQFLGQMEKPDVDAIDGLSPSIAIDQKTSSKNPRSTVGTVTEIYDYLRLLYARIGVPHCPHCGRVIKSITIDQIIDKIMVHPQGAKVIIMAPVVRGRKGEYVKQLDGYKKSGYVRVLIDGITYELDDEITLDKNVKHNISVIIDRLIIKDGLNRRLTDSIELALKLANGLVLLDIDGKEELCSTQYSCPDCDISLPELEPRMFSFNNPFGACESCAGLGYKNEIDVGRIIKHPETSIREGAIRIYGWMLGDMGSVLQAQLNSLAERYGFSLDTPYKELPAEIQNLILYGNNGEKLTMEWNSAKLQGTYTSSYEGVVNTLLRRYASTESEAVKKDIERHMCTKPCESCKGKRLKIEALSVTIGDKNIFDVCSMPVIETKAFFSELLLNSRDTIVAKPIIKEIHERLKFLIDVGLGYLTLSRSSATLSGGESQRIRLATQIGSGLTGVLYILDEPSIGLHQRDNKKLLATLIKLRDLGNTLIVVEHDEETIRAADHIVDIGPGAGINGGYLVAQGSVSDIENNNNSITGDFLAGRRKIALPEKRRKPDGRFLEIMGATHNNLKSINVNIPIGLLTVVTGVSGSGKSSLVNGTIYPLLTSFLNDEHLSQYNFKSVEGYEYVDKIIAIDQSPIGRTPRSNPATYTGLFTPIRELFASTIDSKARGYAAGRFSFNVHGGRCENCSGDGIIKIEMHFLPDVYVPCEVCRGKRYNRETLEVKYKGKSIYDVLDMTVQEGCTFFENIPNIYNKLKCLNDVGLSYIKLGQPSTTLSGGEAQRIKLASELSKRETGRTLYILDEPTTGLHSADVEKLIVMIQRLTNSGNTVIIIEHNLDVIKMADYIIDLGPEGGDAGGMIVAEGTPEKISQNPNSYTGIYLKAHLQQSKL